MRTSTSTCNNISCHSRGRSA
ncbi:CxxxxCH/CxxCH domain-containing protein [Candidatus Pacearchaeota archaeon]|nr:CxxxxCH/CxxCH domain-containing protein [Candidatus Pacearchaeota archaeon]